MKNALKTTFGVAAAGLGSVGTAWGGIGLATGGWSTAGQAGGVDMTLLGVFVTTFAACAAYLGFKALTKKPEGPKP